MYYDLTRDQGSISWLAALTNSALVYLFRPQNQSKLDTAINTDHPHTSLQLNSTLITSTANPVSYDRLIIPALLLALASSHGYFLLRLIVRHVLERLLWKGSKEEQQAEQMEKEVKEQYLQSLGLDTWDPQEAKVDEDGIDGFEDFDGTGFWTRDEGLDEIRKSVKEA